MKNSKTVFQELVASIHLKDDPEEIKSIAHILLETVSGITRTDVVAGKFVSLSPETTQSLQRYVDRINKGEPVQYVVGEETFFGRKFHVNPSVLIPRPETEELIRVVLDYRYAASTAEKSGPRLKILDIGTGSGCIPITLYLELGDVEVYGTDISPAALSVAVDNAENLHAKVTFIEHDVLAEKIPVTGLDVIVSNPPYVAETEKSEMSLNVLGYEPHQALFVSDDNPLIFYNAIVRQSRESLKSNGLLAVEINQRFGHEVSGLFIEAGFREIEIIKDLAGKDRVVKGLNTGLPL
ncbi:MAG TPA: peptide chain release factor N(5)-glutamine methyltransferase [Chryseosolibacter sp.]|nr:peptide chain release factor N(5)-glutamine methyltransferase [Chryseosolibacter sp.]